MKRKKIIQQRNGKNTTLNKIKKLYRYYLECMKQEAITKEDKNRQTNLIKSFLWRLNISAALMEQKDFAAKFLKGDYDHLLNLSILNQSGQPFNANNKKNKPCSLSKKIDEDVDPLKKAYDQYNNGVLPYESFLLIFQEYFCAIIDVYNLGKSDVETITKRNLKRR